MSELDVDLALFTHTRKIRNIQHSTGTRYNFGVSLYVQHCLRLHLL